MRFLTQEGRDLGRGKEPAAETINRVGSTVTFNQVPKLSVAGRAVPQGAPQNGGRPPQALRKYRHPSQLPGSPKTWVAGKQLISAEAG